MKSPNILYIFWVLYFAPLAVNIGYIGDKPVDLALSDVFALALPVLLIASPSLPARHWHFIALLSYFIFLGLLGAFLEGGDVRNIFSAITFSMPFVHLLIGGILARRWGFSLLRTAPPALAAVVFVLLLSDLLFGSFPRGCGTEGRWGGCFFALEVYGFVNSSSGYLAVMVGLLASSLFLSNTKISRMMAIMAIAGLMLIVPLSLSRSAAITIAVILLFTVWSINRAVAVASLALAVISASFVLPLLENSWIGRGLVDRVYAGIYRGDLFSGRFGIWDETLALISDAPIIGHSFGYFSEFSYFGTAHNQYLELMFKSGVLGIIIYFGFMASVVVRARAIMIEYDIDRRVVVIFYGTVLAILLNSLSQPLMNYAVMANVIFLFSGMALAVPLKERQ